MTLTGIQYGTAVKSKDIRGLSSGSLELNAALSGNPFVGFQWGRVVEAFGPEGCGKTTLGLHVVHETQRLRLPAMYIDAEHAIDPLYMEHIGIDLRQLSISQPDCGEDALAICEEAVLAGYKTIVVDSVAMLVPKAELEGNMADAHMGLQARMMGKALRRLAGKVRRKQAIVYFINQIRMKIGVMFGNPETTPGGLALKFTAHYRLDMRAPRGGKVEAKSLTDGTVETGKAVNITVIKNKVYPPFKRATFDIMYGEGIDKPKDVVEFLKNVGGFTPDKKGTNRIVLGKKKYTVNGLIKALRDDSEMQKLVIPVIKEIIQR